ncbi:MAG: leucine-rich repeat domain-containing protein, partial [Clostridia bacterium]|nr:leucine-rich repeat domain-containing protein [Clostridia bacterium]
MKKLIVVVLALMLLIAIYGFSEENSIKAEPFETEEFKCAFLSEDTIEITSYKAKNTDVVIPAQINGYSVVSIGSRAFSNRRVETVVMPDSITTIGDYAFTNSRALEKVTLSKNIKVLGEGAFCRTNLKSITIPDSIETISGNPFEGCAALSEIVISPNHPKFALIDDVLFDKVEKRLICYPGALTKDSYDIPEGTLFIGDYAFYMCGNLKKITIPQGTASIGEGAFASCAYLKTMVFPDSLTTIENEAFANCWSLTNITIPDGVATIGEYAFNNCMYLRAVRIPDSVKMIGKDAFKSCDMLTLTIGSNAYA